MAIVNFHALLKDAQKRGYAVGSFNTMNLEAARAVIRAAERMRSPVILSHAQVHNKYVELEQIAPVLVYAAEHTDVPVSILLDHGYDFDMCLRAMRAGFNAVMYDASKLPYEENVRTTAEMVRIAHVWDCSVEAELGCVARPESGGAEGDEPDDTVDDTSLYTDPNQAQDFVQRTGADALAISFGTQHGLYIKEPKLDLERLRAIRDRTDAPLVMHGGSGTPDKDVKAAVKIGVTKINYYTQMALTVAQKLKAFLDTSESNVFYHHLIMESIDYIEQDAAETMLRFGSEGKA